MRVLQDLRICLSFFSRLPVGSGGDAGALARAAPMVPVAGAIIAVPSALAIILALASGLSAALVATLAVAVEILVTGALHEDGLADCADGFGGGSTMARKLDIMRDSRIGTYGVCALILTLLLRTEALAAVADTAPRLAPALLIAAAALSRAACLLPLVLLAPARPDGLSAAVGRPSRRAFGTAVAIALLLAAPVVFAAPLRATTAILAALAGAALVCGIARRQIAGQTGDVAGAAQQVSATAFLVIYSAGLYSIGR